MRTTGEPRLIVLTEQWQYWGVGVGGKIERAGLAADEGSEAVSSIGNAVDRGDRPAMPERR